MQTAKRAWNGPVYFFGGEQPFAIFFGGCLKDKPRPIPSVKRMRDQKNQLGNQLGSQMAVVFGGAP